MNAQPKFTELGQGDLEDVERSDAVERDEANELALSDMIDTSRWINEWGLEDDSVETVAAKDHLAALLLGSGIPRMTTTVPDDYLRDRYSDLRDTLTERFNAWATAGKPSPLDRYRELAEGWA